MDGEAPTASAMAWSLHAQPAHRRAGTGGEEEEDDDELHAGCPMRLSRRLMAFPELSSYETDGQRIASQRCSATLGARVWKKAVSSSTSEGGSADDAARAAGVD